MKLAGMFLLVAFGVTLAVIIGQRMSTDAMAVVIGVAVGVAASVPTSLLLVALLRRERVAWRQEQPQPQLPAQGIHSFAQQQPFIVLDAASFQSKPQPMPLPPVYTGTHKVTIVGGGDYDV